ncbi:pyridoxal phosphate-dependent aminotransferase [Fructobacillus sp. M2-14]|uniref:Aminotransferase n=1 Tax=Fructobacillus broussonetiae TaxID=2713173 RepID=A0ABS5R0X7_9LACO|nr:pyridoxal phosphate-dependent aminotransferase [Fructobacillus broussonetiae]MBS9339090.1 pyridoxal phosphate-dependent aminotransferase [Fructobacillus broussonetiae]
MLAEEEFTERSQKVQPSATLAVSKKAKEMASAGYDVINLGTGEPDFVTPKNIAQAAISAIESGKTSFYTPVGGTPELRSGIANLAKKLTGQAITANQVTVTSGAKMALYALVQILVNPGDLVVSAKPYWVSYAEQVNLAGGLFEAFSDDSSAGKLTVGALNQLKQTPKLIILNNPTNPSGILYTKDEVQALLDWALEHGSFIIVDEIYGRLVYNNAVFTSALSLKAIAGSRIIVVDGVSKSYSMTGWRMGWAIADETVIQNMNKVLGHMTSNPSAVSQAAALEAVSGDQSVVEEMRRKFEGRLNSTFERIEKIDGIKLAEKPEGAFYFFIQIEDWLLQKMKLDSSAAFAEKLLDDEYVALPAGEGFGMPGYLRLSYAKDQASLDKALDRIEHFIHNA